MLPKQEIDENGEKGKVDGTTSRKRKGGMEGSITLEETSQTHFNVEACPKIT